jgi:RNA polymerase sigma factor (TIGR02999 family)
MNSNRCSRRPTSTDNATPVSFEKRLGRPPWYRAVGRRERTMAIGDAPITALLRKWADGEQSALDRLAPLVYAEVHRLAAAQLRRERPDHTFSATDLVSEAFLRLASEIPECVDRAHFFALAARQMRRILVDHARQRTAEKRGGGDRTTTFDEATISCARPDALCALDDALEALAAFDERKAHVVELHYFGGMGHKEIASALSLHENTVARDLRLAEAWLHACLTDASDEAAS